MTKTTDVDQLLHMLGESPCYWCNDVGYRTVSALTLLGTDVIPCSQCNRNTYRDYLRSLVRKTGP